MSYPDTDWLAVCAMTETQHAHEYVPVMYVIRNRVESLSHYPSTYYEVVTQRMQFSYFNDKRTLHEQEGVIEKFRVQRAEQWNDAQNAAALLIHQPRFFAPFGPHVYNFWSPRSMVPPGRLPPWNFDRLRCFTLPGIDPMRFVFAETVGFGHPEAGYTVAGLFDYTTDEDPPLDT